MKNKGFHRWTYGLVLALGRGSLTQDQWYGGAPIAKFHNKDRREGFALDGSFDSWFVRLPNLIAFSFMCESFYKCRVGQRALIQSNDMPVFHHGAESVWVIILTSYCCGHITIISLPKSVRVNKVPYSIRYHPAVLSGDSRLKVFSNKVAPDGWDSMRFGVVFRLCQLSISQSCSP